ncbi:MAG: 7TM domain-containing protein [Oligoflexus sp.]
MKISLRITVLLLFLIPALSILYKVFVLNLSPLPQPLRDEWTIQVKIDGRNLEETAVFSFPIPENSSRQIIRDLTFQNNGLTLDIQENGTEFPLARWTGDINQTQSFGFQFTARTMTESLDLPKQDRTKRLPASMNPYLSPPQLSEEEAELLQKLGSAILEPGIDKVDSVKRIFFYVSEEIKRSANYETFHDAIELGRGSAFVKSRIFDALVRRAGIPSRIGFGVNVSTDDSLSIGSNRYRLEFMNEVFINDTWFPVDLENRRLGSYPSGFVLFHPDISAFQDQIDILRSLPFLVQPVRINRYNSKAYYDDLKRTDSFFSQISLYRLPIAGQNNLYIILLLPFGAVILAIFRNIFGFSTFGIFTPILLTIFFLETPLSFALFFMALVVFIGFFQRILLDKLFLLAVPRISILLTLVIIAYVAFIIFNNSTFVTENLRPVVLSYFPVVIITVLIERFSIDFTEEGPWNTFKKLLGTLIISFCCFLLFRIEALKLMVFTHPELLLIAIGINLMIGNYKGYRLSEFLRFQDLARKIGA